MKFPSTQVNIIIPVYNNANEIGNCLESIVNQTFKNWEVVCIDDGSTDNTPDILDSWATRDKRITVIHQKNGGASSARNAGLDICTAPFITMVDADDTIEANALEKAYNAMQSHPCDIVIFGTRRITEKHPDVIMHPSIQEGLQMAGASDFPHKIHPASWAKLYRTDIIQQHNIRFPHGIAMGEDYLFNAQYWCYVKKVFCIKEALYAYRDSESSVCKKFMKGVLNLSIYETTIRLPYLAFEYIQACHGGVHDILEWRKSLLASHLIEHDWTINDVPHSRGTRRKLRCVSDECYSSLALHLPATTRFRILSSYFRRKLKGRLFRLLGKIKRKLISPKYTSITSNI